MRITLLFVTCLFLYHDSNAQVPGYVPTDGLIGWWPFNGNAEDQSGNGYDGSVLGATLAPDRNGNANSAYYFSGASTSISIPNTLPSLNPTDAGVTISFWVRSETLSAANTDIFDLRSSDNSDIQVMVNDASSQVNFRYIAYNGPNPPASVGCWASENYPIEWFFVTLTQDYGTNTSKLYSNNVLVCEQVGIAPSLTNPHLNFGSRFDFEGITCCNMVGMLDDFGIWYRVLSQNEITALFNGQGNSPCVSATSVSIDGLGTLYNASDPAVLLTGTPVNGIFIGPGITGNTFDPAAAGVGAHSITYTYVDEGGCVNTAGQCTEVGLGMGLSEPSSMAGGVRVFPNPNRGQFSVELDLQGLVSIQVLDARGRLVHNEVFNCSGLKSTRVLDLSAEAKGVYTVQVQNNGGSVTQTVVIE